jgi:predicted phosphoribosyltransferase
MFELETLASRRDAGRRLAEELERYGGRDDVLVLALPRGGVPVGFEIARRLDAALDVFLVRKLGTPGRPELAIGAIATGGGRLINEGVVRSLNIPQEVIDRVAWDAERELERRRAEYRGDVPPPEVEGKVVILADDGLATGASMAVAVQVLRRRKPARIVVAVGTAPCTTLEGMRELADEVVCLMTPSPFMAVGESYTEFRQVTDQEVCDLLRGAARPAHAGT